MTEKKRGIGDNQPPSEFDEVSGEINDLYDEAKNWLDGEEVKTDAIAENVENLMVLVKEAAKKADALRKKEVTPLDVQKTAIQKKYAPLIADTKGATGKTVIIIGACKKALEPYKLEQQRQKDEKERKLREEAERQRVKAEKALQESTNIEEREEAVEQKREAEKVEKKANAVNRDNVKGMRTIWKVQMCVPFDASKYFWQNDRDEVLAFFQTLAERKVREGMRDIPGFKITQEKVVK